MDSRKRKRPAKKDARSKKIYVTDSANEKYELRPARKDNPRQKPKIPVIDGEDKWYTRSGLGILLQIEDAAQYIVSYFDNPAGLQVAMEWMAESCEEVTIGTALVLTLNDRASDFKSDANLELARRSFLEYNKPPKIANLDKSKRFFISSVGLELGDAGHWGGYIYDKDKNTVSFYDSMQTCGDGKLTTSYYSFWFEAYLKAVFPSDVTVEMQGSDNVSIDSIRHTDRQPTGGCVPFIMQYARKYNYGGGDYCILWDNIPGVDLEQLPSYSPRLSAGIKSIYDYNSQHHFCFMESLLFIFEILARECLGKTFSSDKHPLFQIKRFAWALIHSIPERLYRENNLIFSTVADKTYFKKYFCCVFDPQTRDAKCIMTCDENFDCSQEPFANIVKVLNFAYS
uniref:Uncharacterized protein n=1 Tax=Marseillevirus LCMAC101 TaxID=2506602 RepID=A0A481YRR0_9VIRU|nr:MAG: hypothetical protein LCMAC101_04860 [Marseillevirus LCMAC101]